MDFKNKCNLGYAFINFISAFEAATFTQLQQGKKWKVFKSEKVCSVCFATIQGKFYNLYQDMRVYFYII
jgi:hypothetical protein